MVNMTDPIADMLNRIRNAQAVFHSTVDVPFSNLKFGIAEILEKEGFIGTTEKKGRKNKKSISIVLKYESDSGSKAGKPRMVPAINGLRRVSKPGQRVYLPAKKIKRVKGGCGMAIISTPKGLMTDKEARKQRLGGEVVAEIW